MQAIYREIMSAVVAGKSLPSPTWPGGDLHTGLIRKFGHTSPPHRKPLRCFSEVEKDRPTAWSRSNSTGRGHPHARPVRGEPKNSADRDANQHCLVRNNRRRRFASSTRIGLPAHCRVWLQQNSLGGGHRGIPHVPPKWPRRTKLKPPSPGHSLQTLQLQIVDHASRTTPRTQRTVLGEKCSPSTKMTAPALLLGSRTRSGHSSIMAPFRKHRLNMTKIESRPSKRKAWNTCFS